MEISFTPFFVNKPCEPLMTATAIAVSNQLSHNFAKRVLQVSNSVQLSFSLALLVCCHARQNYWGAGVAVRQRKGSKSYTWTTIPFSCSVLSIPMSPGQCSRYCQSPQACLPNAVSWTETVTLCASSSCKFRACIFSLPSSKMETISIKSGQKRNWRGQGGRGRVAHKLPNAITSWIKIMSQDNVHVSLLFKSSFPSIKGLILLFNSQS